MSLKLDLCAAIFLISLGMPAEAHDIYSHLLASEGQAGKQLLQRAGLSPRTLPSDAVRGAHARQRNLDHRAGPHGPVSRSARRHGGTGGGTLVRGHALYGRLWLGQSNLLHDPTA
jgi:hypothetical protein